MGRWTGRQIGRSPLPIWLFSYLPVLCFGALVVSSIQAAPPQVLAADGQPKRGPRQDRGLRSIQILLKEVLGLL
jgi:hypothetical protein